MDEEYGLPLVACGFLTVSGGILIGSLTVDGAFSGPVSLPVLLAIPGILLLMLAVGGVRTGSGSVLGVVALLLVGLSFWNDEALRGLYLGLLIGLATPIAVLSALAGYQPRNRRAAVARDVLIALGWLVILALVGGVVFWMYSFQRAFGGGS